MCKSFLVCCLLHHNLFALTKTLNVSREISALKALKVANQWDILFPRKRTKKERIDFHTFVFASYCDHNQFWCQMKWSYTIIWYSISYRNLVCVVYEQYYEVSAHIFVIYIKVAIGIYLIYGYCRWIKYIKACLALITHHRPQTSSIGHVKLPLISDAFSYCVLHQTFLKLLSSDVYNNIF